MHEPTPDKPADPRHLLPSLSTQPGVYRMLDAKGEIIYVGKAINLKKRVSSYFRASGLDTKTLSMVARIVDIETTITRTETEALLLEQSLIKKHSPVYNIRLRDDKSYPYILLTERDEFPRLAFYRGSRKRDAVYFGPYPSASAVRESLVILQKVFKLRQCEDSYFRNRSRPCLQYQIARCKAPCVGYVSAQEYAEDVHFTTLFLQGKSDALIKELSARMEQKAAQQEFEQAAQIRDQLADLRHIHEQQYVADQSNDADILAIASSAAHVCVHLIVIRGGRLIGSKNFFPTWKLSESPAQLLAAFVAQYYVREHNGANIPAEIITNLALTENRQLNAALNYCAGHKVRLSASVRGHRAKWVGMAISNAEQGLLAYISNRQNTEKRFEQLRDALQMDSPPLRIECFDISHTGGESTVASCVVFDNKGARKSDYRRYNIKDITAGDDYAAMAQALTRRYGKIARDKLPDILLIDGGKGQLSQARQVLASCGIEGLRLLGIAKGISRRAGQETLFDATAHGDREIALPAESPALHLLQQVRDEAHRFAIAGHRAQRAKTRKQSVLELIPGLGPKRRRELLRHFGGHQEILRASEEQLSAVNGINRKLAEDIYAWLHSE
ncbi:MAG: excinuclease ABC subunit UvrC [Pseudomonadales bacterium]|nr:excinuclease ABC subunit UvrC [Pseudomonadales bacterium]